MEGKMIALNWILGPLVRGLSNGALLFGLGYLGGDLTVALLAD